MQFRLLVAAGLLAISLQAAAQKKVNESCSADKECPSGCHCVTTVNGKKCATCDQSTLNAQTTKVNAACKTCGEGWKPESSPEYMEVKADDDRVYVGVFDDMLEKAKACRNARVERENKCWQGGDAEHKGAIAELEGSIRTLSEHKYRMISDNRVYYSSFSIYRDRLNDYQRYAEVLKTTDLKNYLDGFNKKLKAATKIDCRQAETYRNNILKGVQAALTLLRDCFKNDRHVFPPEYLKRLEDLEKLYDGYDDMIKLAESKRLCS